mmetsp:Transcript_3990/g.11357  ORF Transcript_3990/g.11357 Transcript_3990/m.11357 type:complete len:238 (-) Transcript_3990:2231-2944(-)
MWLVDSSSRRRLRFRLRFRLRRRMRSRSGSSSRADRPRRIRWAWCGISGKVMEPLAFGAGSCWALGMLVFAWQPTIRARESSWAMVAEIAAVIVILVVNVFVVVLVVVDVFVFVFVFVFVSALFFGPRICFSRKCRVRQQNSMEFYAMRCDAMLCYAMRCCVARGARTVARDPNEGFDSYSLPSDRNPSIRFCRVALIWQEELRPCCPSRVCSIPFHRNHKTKPRIHHVGGETHCRV